MKKGLILLMLCVFFIAGSTPAVCMAKEPLRVAVLPVFNSSYRDDQDIERNITEKLHTRLNWLLVGCVIIPDSEVQLALPQELKRNSKPGQINASVLQEIGAKLKADIIMGAQITDFRVVTTRSLDDDLFRQTDVTIRIVVYCSQNNKFLDIYDSQRNAGQWSKLSDPDYLVKEAMGHLLDKVAIYLEKNKPAKKED